MSPENLINITQEELESLAAAHSPRLDYLPAVDILRVIWNSIILGRSMVSWDTGAKFMKLQEVVGELAETALYEQGYNQHKPTPEEDSFGEGADVILCVVDIVSRLHPEMPTSQVYAHLQHALRTKYNKWERRIKALERKTNDRSEQNKQLQSNS